MRPRLTGDRHIHGQIRYTFIIRDPALTLVSHYKFNPDFTMTEAGHESMWKMYGQCRSYYEKLFAARIKPSMAPA